MKRLFDVLVSLAGMVILMPLFVVVAGWVLVDSQGGAFYTQVRVGRRGVDFKLYKFRSMAVDSNKKGALTIGQDDSRITDSGRVIRRYKLDELPQLLNVLLGDMSIVGPRPEVRKYVELYSPEQMKVLDVRPGITDPASIKYRNENEMLAEIDDPEIFYIEHIMPDKLKINEEYIRNATFITDLKVILHTISSLCKPTL